MADQKRDLVLFLERMLERARQGQVQFFIASAAYLPFTPEGWGQLDVEGFSSFGSLVPRLDEQSLRAAYAKTLEGLAQSAGHANEAFEALLERFGEGEK
jgi:hypothetical protein